MGNMSVSTGPQNPWKGLVCGGGANFATGPAAMSILPRCALILLVLLSAQARAAIDVGDGGGGGTVSTCLSKTLARSFGASASTVPLGSSVSFSWSVYVPTGCTVQVKLSGQTVAKTGTLAVFPESNTTYYLTASQSGSATTVVLAQATVSVLLPSLVYITRNDQQRLLVQAVGTPGTTVVVTNNVDMNLSGYAGIWVAAGVTLRGGRTSQTDGPRLYTTAMPDALLRIEYVDNVRITGLRLQGAEFGVGTGGLSRGLRITAANNVLVDNNEISGWTAVGVAIDDDDALNRIDPVGNPETVKVRDNFIHHNQYEGKFGYGVALGAGASALIERNVFDWNRHAIASNGRLDTSYRAYTNLVLENGGFHKDYPIYGTSHTHQFDVHGSDSCGIIGLFNDAYYNCGYGGHSVYLRGNAFLYTAGAAFKLRGTPAVTPTGAFLYDNVFAHGSESDAVQQTTSANIHKLGNLTNINGKNELAFCDFDGDGYNDAFLATGQSWWYSSRGTRAWSYLNTSKLRSFQVELGQFDSTPGCDVRAGGVVYSGGKPASTAPGQTSPGGVLAP